MCSQSEKPHYAFFTIIVRNKKQQVFPDEGKWNLRCACVVFAIGPWYDITSSIDQTFLVHESEGNSSQIIIIKISHICNELQSTKILTQFLLDFSHDITMEGEGNHLE